MTHPGKPQIASCATDGRPGGQLGESGDQPGGGRAFRRRKKTTLGEYYPYDQDLVVIAPIVWVKRLQHCQNFFSHIKCKSSLPGALRS